MAKTITYTFTGEHRQPKPGEWYYYFNGIGVWPDGWDEAHPEPRWNVDILVDSGEINENKNK